MYHQREYFNKNKLSKERTKLFQEIGIIVIK